MPDLNDFHAFQSTKGSGGSGGGSGCLWPVLKWFLIIYGVFWTLEWLFD